MTKWLPLSLQEVGLRQTRFFPHHGKSYLGPFTIGVTGLEKQAADEILIVSTNGSWKSVRAALSPMFSTDFLQSFMPMLKTNSARLVT